VNNTVTRTKTLAWEKIFANTYLTKNMYPKRNTLQKKYLGINPTKYVQNLHEETHKTLRKETKDLNKQKHISYAWIGGLNIVKMPVLPNQQIQCNPNQNPSKLFYGY